MKPKLRRRVLRHAAVFEPDEERGGYTVYIPALPGCISEGDTFEEALANIREAASLYIEVMAPERIAVAEQHAALPRPHRHLPRRPAVILSEAKNLSAPCHSEAKPKNLRSSALTPLSSFLIPSSFLLHPFRPSPP